MPHPTPTDVQAAFIDVSRPIEHADAILIAREMVAYDGLANALAAVVNDAGHRLHTLLLSYSSALAEQTEPLLRVRRLLTEANDLDARAEPLWTEGAAFAGRAAWRKLQREDELADVFQRKAEAAETLASKLEADAFAKRLEAASLEAALACRQNLNEALRTIAA